jgi:ribose 5-phosphate isomerase B
MKKMVLGADHAGYQLKERLAAYLRGKGFAVEDIGCHDETSVDYPNIAQTLAKALKVLEKSEGVPVLGILCCGSGIGICISANRFPWIRAVVATDHYTAVMSRRHNDTNVLCLGGRVIAPELAFDILDAWLATPFDGGRHQTRVDLMSQIQVEDQALPGGAPAC